MSDYPKAFKHRVSKQERYAASAAQEVALRFDGFRPVETEAPAAESEKTEEPDGGTPAETGTPKVETTATPPTAPKATTPKPGPTPKAQEGK